VLKKSIILNYKIQR